MINSYYSIDWRNMGSRCGCLAVSATNCPGLTLVSREAVLRIGVKKGRQIKNLPWSLSFAHAIDDGITTTLSVMIPMMSTDN